MEAYWNIGRHIVERQGGDARAEYGAGLIKELSEQMTKDFGRGFTVANLKNMRQFYLTFPNGYTLRSELSWSHYRLFMRVENANARSFYLDECVKSLWSARSTRCSTRGSSPAGTKPESPRNHKAGARADAGGGYTRPARSGVSRSFPKRGFLREQS